MERVSVAAVKERVTGGILAIKVIGDADKNGIAVTPVTTYLDVRL
jgi:hypothetical protein